MRNRFLWAQYPLRGMSWAPDQHYFTLLQGREQPGSRIRRRTAFGGKEPRKSGCVGQMSKISVKKHGHICPSSLCTFCEFASYRFPLASAAQAPNAFAAIAQVQTTSAARPATVPQPRITQVIDERNLVRLSGNVHRLARPEYDQGAVSDAMLINRILLLLQRWPRASSTAKHPSAAK